MRDLLDRQEKMRDLTTTLAIAIQPQLKGLNGITAAMNRSPAFDAMTRIQDQFQTSPLVEGLQRASDALAERFAPQINDGIFRASEVLGNAIQPQLKGLNGITAAMNRSPAFDAMTRIQDQFQTSPLVEGLQGIVAQLDRQLSHLIVNLYESQFLDEFWAEREVENPEHPPPVLYVVATLPAALGRPLYEAVKDRRDEQLLEILEPVLTQPSFLQDLETAVVVAPHLGQVTKEHLITALSWMTERRYVNAYPPFYNGLEAAFTAVATERGVIDDEKRFLVQKARVRRAKKVEDLFEHLQLDPQYRRYLRSWIFGERGNPFRHGDVNDVGDCRRQSLRLQMALIGWLETFAGWDASAFRGALEVSARDRMQAQLHIAVDD